MPTSTADSHPTLLEIQYSFGFCGGVCIGLVVFDGTDIEFEGSEHGGEVVLSVTGRLTESGFNRLEEAVGDLSGLTHVDPSYGSPAATDGGRLAYRIVLDGLEYTTAYDFSFGLVGDGAPNEFAKLDEFAKSILESIWECQSSSTIEITSCHGAEAPSN